MTIKIQIKLLFFICGSNLRNMFILDDMGAEENISDVYCSSSDLL